MDLPTDTLNHIISYIPLDNTIDIIKFVTSNKALYNKCTTISYIPYLQNHKNLKDIYKHIILEDNVMALTSLLYNRNIPNNILYKICKYGNIKCFTSIYRRYGCTMDNLLLYYSCTNPNTNILQYLLENNYKVDDNCLSICIFHKLHKNLNLLLTKEFNKNARHTSKNEVIRFQRNSARKREKMKGLPLLPKWYRKRCKTTPETTNINMLTYACQKSNVDVVRALINGGFNLYEDNHSAVFHCKNANILQFILQYYNKDNINEINWNLCINNYICRRSVGIIKQNYFDDKQFQIFKVLYDFLMYWEYENINWTEACKNVENIQIISHIAQHNLIYDKSYLNEWFLFVLKSGNIHLGEKLLKIGADIGCIVDRDPTYCMQGTYAAQCPHIAYVLNNTNVMEFLFKSGLGKIINNDHIIDIWWYMLTIRGKSNIDDMIFTCNKYIPINYDIRKCIYNKIRNKNNYQLDIQQRDDMKSYNDRIKLLD
ncbi:Ankyrin-repeat protein [Orpheovirus IHUMI-LCC2]|uniref:Ankyrin-repeat protein n=1 Tax=Orpheovirus IHUMI-LCC2 TaxID=2023057 RepID=A0A2I2L5U0_9VIRU|nr:Ankyrin-repeat protein [Orpheovirus IHUMI-LCC2]SNW62881.1 Ankyrin-repeat protein [Orpheovirus IHUMI-LCC2]